MWLFLSSMHYGADYMYLQWAIGIAGAALLFSKVIGKRTSWVAGIATSYALLSGLYLCATEFNRYADRPELLIKLSYLTRYSVICIILFAVFVAFGEKIKPGLISFYTFLNSLYVILGAYFGFGYLPDSGGSWVSGFLNIAGMNGILIAMGISFLKFWMIPFALVAIYLSHASQPYGVLFVACVSYFIKSRTKLLIPIAIGAILFAFIGHPHLLHDSSRFEAYRTFMGEWWRHANIWVGTGPGTFRYIGPMIQEQTGFMLKNGTGNLWQWIHSDWLQVAFEYGIIGGILSMILAVDIATRLWRKLDQRYFAMFIAGVSAGLFDFPLRYFPTTFLIAICAREAYR